MYAATLLLATISFGFVINLLLGGDRIKRHGRPLRKAPNTLPVLGNGILFLRSRHKLFSWFVKCEKLFGFETFQISVPTLPPGVVINDPKNLEYVFKNEGIFGKGEFFKCRSWDLFGNGIINADGDLWKIQRKAGLQFLNNSNIKVLTEVALPKYLQETVLTMDKYANGGTVVDLEAVFHELTTQVMGKMAYNLELHHTDPFSEAFDYASGATGQRFQNPLWKLTEVFFGHQFRESVKIVKDFGTLIVLNAIKSRQEGLQANDTTSHTAFPSLDSTSGSLINSLLDSIADQQVVADAALNYLSAGRDTTAQALTWTFYLLMRHPNALERLRSEVMDFAKTGSAATEELDTSTFRPASLPYATAVLYEALRLFPPVPFELKQCEKPTTLPDGTSLPKDSILIWCTWAMNRSKRLWGQDAEDFTPSRWIENGVLISKSAFEYPVFNGGPRTCLGKKMAEAVAVQVMAAFVLRFHFEHTSSSERISKNSLTLPMEGGLPCRIMMYE